MEKIKHKGFVLVGLGWLKNAPYPPHAKILYMLIKGYIKFYGSCDLTVEQMALTLGWKTNTVDKYKKILVDAGIIRWTRRTYNSNVYEVNEEMEQSYERFDTKFPKPKHKKSSKRNCPALGNIIDIDKKEIYRINKFHELEQNEK
jgi:hypothetical protein